MATGYDRRDGGRASFSFEPAKVSQSQTVQSAGFRGVSLQGGNTSVAGGVAAAAQFTEPRSDSAQIGGFLNELLAPAIERRKKEQFVKGMVDQMSAVSGEEIRVNSNNPINRIFGPSSYEEGAIFYSAKDAVNKWSASMLADMDNLKRLPPEELTKVVAKSFEAMKTGDQFTDLAVDTALIEASQPVIGAVAKERYQWQQGEARKSFTQASGSAADAFQKTMTSLASTGDPNDAGNLAANSAANNFLASMRMPPGMDEDTYKKSLIGLYRQFAQNGNGYAVSALKQSGFLDVLNDEEVVRLEDAELKYANRALGRAAVGHAEALDQLNFNMTFGKISATDAMATLATINEKIKSETGFDVDLFDYKEVTGAGKTVWSALKSKLDEQRKRREQLEDITRRENFERSEREAEAADEAAQVQAVWATGQIKTGLAAEIGSGGNYDILAQADYAAGNWSNILRAYNKDQWVSSLVRDQVQAQVGSSIGQEYNKDFEQGYKLFSALNKAKPAAAMAYYGDLYPQMLNYERLVSTGRLTPSMAHQRAFTNLEQYAPTEKLTKQAYESIDSWIKSNRGSTWGSTLGFGRTDLSPSGQVALKNTMARQLGVMMKNSDMPVEALIPNLYTDLKRSGAFEDYGRLGWSNKPGTPSIMGTLRLQQDEADQVVEAVVDKRLKASGFSDGIGADNFDIKRIRDQNGNPVLTVIPYDEDEGAGTMVIIPMADFKKEADRLIAERVNRGRGSSGTRIKGETAAQRIARRNLEAVGK